jgi:phosphoadenosine phosphosulfate reductase
MSDLSKKVEASVKRLRTFEPPEGYYLAFSGGKDSVVVKALCDLAGVKYDGHYCLTTADPPELVRFVRDRHRDVSIDKAFYPDDYRNERLAGEQITMWNLIPEERFPPTRLMRYCCKKLKERGGAGRVIVTGVRWAESVNRRDNQGPVVIHGINAADELEGQESLFDDDPTIQRSKRFDSAVLMADNDENRKLVEFCYMHHKTTVNPIVEWEDAEVWEFIKAERIPYCDLYNRGYERLGCIGCPMSRPKKRLAEFEAFPKYKYHYFKAFERMLEKRRERAERVPGKSVWKGMDGRELEHPTAQDVFNWWLSE